MHYKVGALFGAALLPSCVRCASPEALNTTNTNLFAPNGDGPVLYYNGTGSVPSYNEISTLPAPITPTNNSSESEDDFYKQLLDIANGTSSKKDKCGKCTDGANVLHMAAVSLAPKSFVNVLIKICEAEPAVQAEIYAIDCKSEFGNVQNTSYTYTSGGAGIGYYWAQLFAKMSDGDYETYCYYNWKVCDYPEPIGIQEDLYFSEKTNTSAPSPSGETFNVLHLSDWHLDPRYDIGSEGNCSQYLCCRPYSTNEDLETVAANASVPASRFGNLYCDAPPDLALSAFASMPKFFELSNVSFSLFTGDIVSHDNDDQLSKAYVSYEEEVTYQTFKAQLSMPVYATLGNHDSFPEAFNTQNALNNGTNAMSWNYELLSSMWANSSWITSEEQQYASTHYGAYAHTTATGLRIISLNTDFWYTDNIFNYWNITNPDTSGILAWLANELAACEARGQRAWIIGHVLSGYDGSNDIANPTALFYSIVVRFAPTTIAGIFFGHTHEDQLQIFYDYLPNSTYTANGVTLRNTTMVDYSKPLMVAYIVPSITPLTGLNAGYRLYQVDASTFEVTGSQTYFANVSESLSWTDPASEWRFEYDARETYGGSWPADAPLNATFWHGVTEEMLKNHTLVETYNFLETKSSVTTKNCSSEACAKQKVCYLRSGSGTLGRRCGKKNGPF